MMASFNNVSQAEIDRANPFLARIKEPAFNEWSEILRRDPRDLWHKPFGQVPESYIEELDNLFEPNYRNREICATLMRLLVSGLRRRNPRIAKPLKFIAYLASLQREKVIDLEKLDFSRFVVSASGAVIQGPSGTAKSHSVDAFMGSIEQVVDCGSCEEGGWMSLRHLAYLKVYMPSDHSRSSFLLAIAAEMDSVLGHRENTYLAQIDKIKGIEKQLIFIITKLAIHQCGMLFVEEAQENNFKTETWRNEFVTFFLRIMNAGVPLVLIGNPKAFTPILGSTQPLRRLVKGGIFNMMPAYDEHDLIWMRSARKIWGWTVFDAPDDYVPDDRLLYVSTGGFYGYLVQLRKETLVLALRMGAKCVQKSHFINALRSANYSQLLPVIKGYVEKDPTLVKLMKDEPVDFVEKRWAETVEERTILARAAKPITG